MERGSQHLGKIIGQHSRPQFHLSLLGSLAAEVGTYKPRGGSGSHNKPIGCGASEAYSPGPEEEEEMVNPFLCVPCCKYFAALILSVRLFQSQH